MMDLTSGQVRMMVLLAAGAAADGPPVRWVVDVLMRNECATAQEVRGLERAGYVEAYMIDSFEPFPLAEGPQSWLMLEVAATDKGKRAIDIPWLRVLTSLSRAFQAQRWTRITMADAQASARDVETVCNLGYAELRSERDTRLDPADVHGNTVLTTLRMTDGGRVWMPVGGLNRWY